MDELERLRPSVSLLLCQGNLKGEFLNVEQQRVKEKLADVAMFEEEPVEAELVVVKNKTVLPVEVSESVAVVNESTVTEEPVEAEPLVVKNKTAVVLPEANDMVVDAVMEAEEPAVVEAPAAQRYVCEHCGKNFFQRKKRFVEHQNKCIGTLEEQAQAKAEKRKK